jgi:hypothetical protein
VAAEAPVARDGARAELELLLLGVHRGHLAARLVERHHRLQVVEQHLVDHLLIRRGLGGGTAASLQR